MAYRVTDKDLEAVARNIRQASGIPLMIDYAYGGTKVVMVMKGTGHHELTSGYAPKKETYAVLIGIQNLLYVSKNKSRYDLARVNKKDGSFMYGKTRINP